MITSQFLWPNGNRLALTSCWDDGTIYDRQLLEIWNRYGLKGSFNLCTGKFGSNAWKEFIREEEVVSLYQGHEVCSHSVNHPRPWSLPLDQWRWEILEDRRRLEALVGYPVRGFVLPFGWVNGYELSKEFIRQCGFKYLRQTKSFPDFDLPADFMEWRPTCHCNANFPKLWDTMLERGKDQPGQLFYLWGHSYEFDESLGWENIEAFAALASNTPSVWHATKGEVYDYITAWRSLDWSLDGTLVRNPSAATIWFLRNGQTIKIDGGQFLHLDV